MFQSFNVTKSKHLLKDLLKLKRLGFFDNLKDLMLIIAYHSNYTLDLQYNVADIPFPKFLEIIMQYIRDIPTTLVSGCCYGTEFQRFIYHLSPRSKVITMCSWRFGSTISGIMIYYLKKREFSKFMTEVMDFPKALNLDLCVIVTRKDLNDVITFIN